MTIAQRDYTRRLPTGADQAVQVVRAVLEQAGFKIRMASLTTLSAERGSAMAVTKRGAPIRADATITPGDSDTVVTVRFADRSPVPFASNAVKRNYESLFAELETALDAALDAGHPQSAGGPHAPAPGANEVSQTTRPTNPATASAVNVSAMTEQAGAALSKMAEAARSKVNTGRARATDEAWQRVGEVWFAAPEEITRLDAADLQSHLAVAAMIERQPGSLPDHLASQLKDFSGHVTSSLNSAGAVGMSATRLDLEPEEKPILEFLHLQARIREVLPVRTLHRCLACRHESVSNPDYKKLVERNRKIRALTGAVGLTMRAGAVSPFLLVGALFRMRKLDPDYVCSRCQGMEAEESITTFCPDCGELRKEAVLKSCGRCSHDFRKDPEPEVFWQTRPEGW